MRAKRQRGINPLFSFHPQILSPKRNHSADPNYTLRADIPSHSQRRFLGTLPFLFRPT